MLDVKLKVPTFDLRQSGKGVHRIGLGRTVADEGFDVSVLRFHQRHKLTCFVPREVRMQHIITLKEKGMTVKVVLSYRAFREFHATTDVSNHATLPLKRARSVTPINPDKKSVFQYNLFDYS